MEKKSIYFLVAWGKDKQRAWSGTNWGLFQALSKRMDVEDIDITVERSFITRVKNKIMGNITRVKNKIMGNITRVKNKNMGNTSDMGLISVLKGSKIALNVIKQHGPRDAVFQFTDVLPDTCWMPTYLYVDLTADYVGYMMEHAPDDFCVSGFQKNTKRNIIKRGVQQNKYLETCSGVFTMGHWLAKDLLERRLLSAARVHHVGGGINLDRTLIDESHKAGNKFLFVGKDFVRKNGPLVYEAFNLLKEAHPDWELHVAGPAENPYPDDTSGQYHYHGDCNHEQLSDLFNACDVFVMPSRFEAYGLVFIEALSYGLPCIGRDAYEMPYFIEDGITGRLLKGQSAETLSQLMEETITTPKYSKEVKARREQYLKEYSWDTVAERIETAMTNNSCA